MIPTVKRSCCAKKVISYLANPSIIAAGVNKLQLCTPYKETKKKKEKSSMYVWYYLMVIWLLKAIIISNALIMIQLQESGTDTIHSIYLHDFPSNSSCGQLFGELRDYLKQREERFQQSNFVFHWQGSIIAEDDTPITDIPLNLKDDLLFEMHFSSLDLVCHLHVSIKFIVLNSILIIIAYNHIYRTSQLTKQQKNLSGKQVKQQCLQRV